MNQQKQLRFSISEIELHGYKNESKKCTVEESVFLHSFLMSLKQTAVN